MPPVYYSVMPSPVGPLTLRWSGTALGGLSFDHPATRARRRDWTLDDASLAPVRTQLEEYFRGERKTFDVPLTFDGDAFQQLVWNALLEVGFGTTISYGELALRIGRPKWPGAQEVGAALNQNPIAVIAPCHRVIGADGSLTGFGGGLDRKRWLLTHEGCIASAVDSAQTRLPLFD